MSDAVRTGLKFALVAGGLGAAFLMLAGRASQAGGLAIGTVAGLANLLLLERGVSRSVARGPGGAVATYLTSFAQRGAMLIAAFLVVVWLRYDLLAAAGGMLLAQAGLVLWAVQLVRRAR
ncbi:MAG: hypothetical protein HY335_07600 [Deinococcus sp.]|nr:hypothetical protein [Deinococcus sp.]